MSSAGNMLRVVPFSGHKTWTNKISSVDVFSSRPIDLAVKCSLNLLPIDQNLIGKLRERITNGVELSPSAYDTAWVAMVPSKEYYGSKQPCFPQCLDWIMDNQNGDGSWGLNPGHPYLVKDSLSCTLACLLALRKWDVGEQLVQRGLDFIASNGWATSHKDQFSPIGFNIIFPGMVSYAKELDLTLPLNPTLVDSLLHMRDSEIRRNQNLEYVAEGFGNSCNWKEIIMQHQSCNGSLFNSPATTAAALIHSHDDKCLKYLTSVLNACNKWVPTIYPMDIYTRLCLIDTLERLGISGYFEHELSCIADEVYRCWQEKEEEIFSDISCRAMAFRILRTRGYSVSSDELAEFAEQDHFFNKVSLQYKGVATVLELYRASQLRIYEEEDTLVRIGGWTSAFLKQKLLNQTILDKRLQKQVECDLKNPHGELDRVLNRRSMEQYDAQGFQITKTAYKCPTIHNEDIIMLSQQYFRISQAQYQREFQEIERWYADCRLDRLNRGRNIFRICFNLGAAILVPPELYECRMSHIQSSLLLACIDDFVDLYGSREEVRCLVELVSNWNMQPATTYWSEEVEIIFTALYNTVNEIAAKASAEQGRCVKHHYVSMWVEVITNFAREKEPAWNEDDVSTLEEYLSFAWKTIGIKTTVLAEIFFLGRKLPEEMFSCAEFTTLCYHACSVCRLMNDMKTFKKEQDERSLNSVNLLTVKGGLSEDEAILKLEQILEFHKRKMMQTVYQREGSVVPRECKDLFTKTCQQVYGLYHRDGGDEFSNPQEFAKDLDAAIWDPLQLPSSSFNRISEA